MGLHFVPRELPGNILECALVLAEREIHSNPSSRSGRPALRRPAVKRSRPLEYRPAAPASIWHARRGVARPGVAAY